MYGLHGQLHETEYIEDITRRHEDMNFIFEKKKPEKIRLAGIRTLTSAIPVQRSNQLSSQANWDLVVNLVRNIPGKDEDEIMNI